MVSATGLQDKIRTNQVKEWLYVYLAFKIQNRPISLFICQIVNSLVHIHAREKAKRGLESVCLKHWICGKDDIYKI